MIGSVGGMGATSNVGASNSSASEVAPGERQPEIERMGSSSANEKMGNSSANESAESGGGGTDPLEMLKKIMNAVQDIMSSVMGMVSGAVGTAMNMMK